VRHTSSWDRPGRRAKREACNVPLHADCSGEPDCTYGLTPLVMIYIGRTRVMNKQKKKKKKFRHVETRQIRPASILAARCRRGLIGVVCVQWGSLSHSLLHILFFCLFALACSLSRLWRRPFYPGFPSAARARRHVVSLCPSPRPVPRTYIKSRERSIQTEEGAKETVIPTPRLLLVSGRHERGRREGQRYPNPPRQHQH